MKIDKIIYFSACMYEGIYQRPQAFAVAFNSLGYEVDYVTQFPVHRFYKAKRKKRISRKINSINLFTASTYFRADNFLSKSITRVFEVNKIVNLCKGNNLVIIGSPIWSRYARAIKNVGCKIVYDCYDDWGLLEENHRHDLDALEKELLLYSDLVTVTTSALAQKVTNICADKKILLLPNAVEVDHFCCAAGKGEGVRTKLSIDGPVAGFLGAIYDWVDEGLLYELAIRLPWLNLVLCGPVRGFNTERLDDLPNVFFTGMVPYNEVPDYIDMFDVALVPFRNIERIKTVNSNKFYQYLSLGKPIVAIDMPSLKEFGELVLVGKNYEEFITNVERAYNEKLMDSIHVKKRVDYAKKNDWKFRVKEILGCF